MPVAGTNQEETLEAQQAAVWPHLQTELAPRRSGHRCSLQWADYDEPMDYNNPVIKDLSSKTGLLKSIGSSYSAHCELLRCPEREQCVLEVRHILSSHINLEACTMTSTWILQSFVLTFDLCHVLYIAAITIIVMTLSS